MMEWLTRMLANIFIFHDPSDSEFARWLGDGLARSGYRIVRSFDQSQVVLFVLTPAAIGSPWLESFQRRLQQKRESGELEILFGAILHDNLLHNPASHDTARYDFIVDFTRNTPSAALSELSHRIEGQPEGWGLDTLPSPPGPPEASEGTPVHLSFPVDLFLDWLRAARARVWVLCTFSTLIDRGAEILDALRRGAHVRFLLLEPGSSLARQRAQDIFHFGDSDGVADDDQVSRFVRESIRQFNELYATAEGMAGSLELRLYETMPTFSAYVCDERALIGFYPHAVRSTRYAHLEVRLDTRFGAQVMEEYERLWGAALPYRMAKPPEAAMEANATLPEPLTEAELRVLGLVCRGLSNQEIADQLVVQYSTVRAHKNHIYSKLGITSSPTLLVVRARELGLAGY